MHFAVADCRGAYKGGFRPLVRLHQMNTLRSAQVRRISWVRGVVGRLLKYWHPRTSFKMPADPFFVYIQQVELVSGIKVTKKPPKRTASINIKPNQLLDFCFLEFDMLFRNRIIFCFDHFIGHCAAVFLCNVEEAGVCSTLQLDFDGGRFCHFIGPQ